MIYITRIFKLIILSIISCVGILIFTGCGATVNTVLDVRNDFSGTREISVRLSKSDLRNYAETDSYTIENIVKKYLPKEMSFIRSDENSDVIFKFKMSFSDLGEYRTKVGNILQSSSEIKPEIIVDVGSSEFKSGIYIKENFTSADLMDWLYDGLKTEKLIDSKNYSQWININSTQVKFEESTYNCSHKIYVDELNDHTLDDVSIYTYFLSDGTFKRKIDFTISDENEKFLHRSGKDLYKIISLKLPADSEIITYENQASTTVSVIFTSDDTIGIINGTDKLLSVNNTVFDVSSIRSQDAFGISEIKIEDYCDASFYLNYSDSPDSHRTVYIFDNAELKYGVFKKSNIFNEKDAFEKNHYSEEAFTSLFSVPISFDEVSLNIQGDSNINSELILTSYISTNNLNDDIAKSSLTETVEYLIEKDFKNCSLDISEKKNKVIYKVNFKNTSANDFSEVFSEFIKIYTGKSGKFTIKCEDLISPGMFNNAFTISISLDISDLAENNINFTYKPDAFTKITAQKNIRNIIRNKYSETNDGTVNFSVILIKANPAGFIILLVLIIIVILAALNIGSYFTGYIFKPKKEIQLITQKNIMGLTVTDISKEATESENESSDNNENDQDNE